MHAWSCERGQSRVILGKTSPYHELSLDSAHLESEGEGRISKCLAESGRHISTPLQSPSAKTARHCFQALKETSLESLTDHEVEQWRDQGHTFREYRLFGIGPETGIAHTVKGVCGGTWFPVLTFYII